MKSIVSAILIMCICNTLYSQSATISVLNSGGGSSLSHPGFSLDWNIGESTVTDSYSTPNPFTTILLSNYIHLTCGVLQPLDNSMLFYSAVASNSTSWTNDDIRLLPVPTKDIVTIDFRTYSAGKINIYLFDNMGFLLRKNSFTNSNLIRKQDWDLSMYKTGIYFFHIVLQNTDDNSILKTGSFQVIKL